MPRLLLLAAWRLARSGLPLADAEDVVNDAISKTIAGIRLWNRDECTLFQHLAGVIVSDVSHRARAPERRLVQDQATRPNGHTTWPPDLVDDGPNQEEVTAWAEEQRRLLVYLADVDPVLGKMAELILVDDLSATRDLYLKLDVSPAEVANLRKRMKRAVRRYLEEDRS